MSTACIGAWLGIRIPPQGWQRLWTAWTTAESSATPASAVAASPHPRCGARVPPHVATGTFQCATCSHCLPWRSRMRCLRKRRASMFSRATTVGGRNASYNSILLQIIYFQLSTRLLFAPQKRAADGGCGCYKCDLYLRPRRIRALARFCMQIDFQRATC